MLLLNGDVAAISQLIGSLGFPIVCCIVMFKQNSELQKTLSDLGKTLSTMNERLKDVEEEVKK